MCFEIGGVGMFKYIEELDCHLNMSDDERIEKALNASKTLMSYLQSMFVGEAFYNAYLQIYSIFCCADRDVKVAEYELFKILTDTNVTYDEFYRCIVAENKSVDLDEFFEFANNQDDDFKQALLEFTLCIFTCDHYIHRDELKIIDEYF